MNKVSGIYKIINKADGKYYVGSSKDIYGSNGRYKYHLKCLRSNTHRNDYLQNAWNKYGKDNFDFLLVESVSDVEKLLEIEQKYLDIAKNEQDKCYNLEFKSTGGQWSEHTKNKMRGSNNPNYGKKNIGGNHFGNTYFKGRTHSEETKQKMREAALRRKNRQENLSLLPATI